MGLGEAMPFPATVVLPAGGSPWRRLPCSRKFTFTFMREIV